MCFYTPDIYWNYRKIQTMEWKKIKNSRVIKSEGSFEITAKQQVISSVSQYVSLQYV